MIPPPRRGQRVVYDDVEHPVVVANVLPLLAREPGLTAIFALSDAIALGAMRAICDLGLHMPNDVSVVGYDGIAAAYFCIPRLTTIRQDVEQLATRGVQTLLQAIHYKNPPIYETIGFELMEFESVRSVEPQ